MNANGRDSIYAGFIACLSILMSAGCGTLGSREPDWVRNPKSVYPENEYLVSVGEGDTRRAAENAAAANLSRIFESHIYSDERMVDRISETTDTFTRTTDLTSDVNILSSQTLINIQHAEAWKDDLGRYHAVAYLDRRETAGIYRDRIEEKTGRVQALLAYAAVAEAPIERYAYLRSALRTASENDLLLRQLRVIHPTAAAAMAPPYSVNEARKAATDAAKAIRVGIRMEGDTSGQLTVCLQDLVTRYGFVVGSPAVLEIRGTVSIDDTGQRTAGLAFFRYAMSLEIRDDRDRVLLALNEKGREAVTSPAEAQVRCYRTLENIIRAKGIQRLDAFFDSLVEQAR